MAKHMAILYYEGGGPKMATEEVEVLGWGNGKSYVVRQSGKREWVGDYQLDLILLSQAGRAKVRHEVKSMLRAVSE